MNSQVQRNKLASILLALCILLSLLPTNSFAEEHKPREQMRTSIVEQTQTDSKNTPVAAAMQTAPPSAQQSNSDTLIDTVRVSLDPHNIEIGKKVSTQIPKSIDSFSNEYTVTHTGIHQSQDGNEELSEDTPLNEESMISVNKKYFSRLEIIPEAGHQFDQTTKVKYRVDGSFIDLTQNIKLVNGKLYADIPRVKIAFISTVNIDLFRKKASSEETPVTLENIKNGISTQTSPSEQTLVAKVSQTDHEDKEKYLVKSDNNHHTVTWVVKDDDSNWQPIADLNAKFEEGKEYGIQVTAKSKKEYNGLFKEPLNVTFAGLKNGFTTNIPDRTPNECTITYPLGMAPKAYQLNVTNATFTVEGDNEGKTTGMLREGTKVTLTPNTLAGKKFKEWKIMGNSDFLPNKLEVNPTFHMPNRNVDILAVHQELPPEPEFNITIIGGTADKQKAKLGDPVSITANDAEPGKRFKEWKVIKGDVQLVSPEASATSFNMSGETVEIEAVFEDNQPPSPMKHRVTVEHGTFTVENVSPADHMVEKGKTVSIQANVPSDKLFDKWVVKEGNVALADEAKPDTTFVMGEKNVTVTATFKDKPQPPQPPAPMKHRVTVEHGTFTVENVSPDDHMVAKGKIVSIQANVPAGKLFDKWVVKEGNVALADEAKPNTTFVMGERNVTVTAMFKDKPQVPQTIAVESVSLERRNAVLNKKGDTITLTAQIHPSQATNKNVIWSSANPEVATVDQNGTVTAVDNGNTVIHVTTQDGQKTDSCLVEVKIISSPQGGGGSGSGGSSGSGGGQGNHSSSNKKDEGAKNAKEVPDSIKPPETKGEDNTLIPPAPKSPDHSSKRNNLEQLSDVKKSDWFYSAVEKTIQKGLMNGTSKTNFSPNLTTNRAMIVSILYNLSGTPATSAKPSFKDVKNNAYYANAIAWASENNIVNGISKDSFAPDQKISREQFAVILYNYAKSQNFDVTPEPSLSLNGFNDVDQISPYAATAVKWAYGEGLLNGKTSDLLDPKGETTRAQAAVIVIRFSELIGK